LTAMVINPEQCRAARAWLDWKQEDLSREAGISMSTVREFEKGRRKPMANNAKAMTAAIERAGLRLTFSSTGVPKGVEKKDP